MELRQLAYFVAVVEEANFTRAAERMHVAQPGISAQIRQLEKEFGHQLLDRSGRTVRLTEMGAAVLPHARAALRAVEGAKLAVDELAGLVRGHLAIGMVTSHPVDIPVLLAQFHDDFPAVEITLAEANSGKLVDDLHGGRLDVAIVGLATDLPGLDPVPLICLPDGTAIRAILENACTTAGFRPRVAFDAATPSVLADLAARGLGIAILPESLVRNRADLHPITVTGAELRGRLAWGWRASGPRSPAARAFIATLRNS